MATTSSPYGLRPVGLLGGYPYAGATRMYKIASGYSVAIQFGDPVLLLTGASGGVINRFNGTTTATTVTSSGTFIGVFMGCTYTDTTLGKVFRQSYTGGIVASDIQAYVADDPNIVFQAQGDEAMTQINIGCNYSLIQTVAGSSTDNRISGVSIDTSSANSTNTLPVRVIGVAELPGNSITSTYPDLLCVINTHFYKTATGNATT